MGNSLTMLNTAVSNMDSGKKVFIVDVSYSMCDELPALRTHLKNCLAGVTGKFDLLWFSSRGQAGYVLEDFEMVDHAGLETAKAAIDRWVKPVGMTCFADPLKLVLKKSQSDKEPIQLVFLTDGWDNGSTRREIINICSDLKDYVSSVKFVEYGPYCHTDLLSEMASVMGGERVYTDSQSQMQSSMAIEDPLVINTTNPVFIVTESGVRVVTPFNGRAVVPKNATIFEKTGDEMGEDELYALISAYCDNGERFDECDELVMQTQDIALIKRWNRTINKTQFAELKKFARDLMMDSDLRYAEGRGEPLQYRTSVYSVLCFLRNTGIQFDSGKLRARSITASRETNSANLHEIHHGITHINGIVLNKNTPNVSISYTVTETVTLPDNKWGMGSYKGETVRNKNVISSGILNMIAMEVILTDEAQWDYLSECVNEPWTGEGTYTLDFESIPVFDRPETTNANILEDLAARSLELLLQQAHEKVFKDAVADELAADKNAKMLERFTQDQIDFLKEQDIGPNGYSPTGTTTVHNGDVLIQTHLLTKIKGASSLPKVSAVEAKIAGGKKLNAADQRMAVALTSLQASDDAKGNLKNWKFLVSESIDYLARLKFEFLCSPRYAVQRLDLLEDSKVIEIGDDTITVVIDETEKKL
jgi:hypothetical protein